MAKILTVEPFKTVYKVTLGQSIWIANLCPKNYYLARRFGHSVNFHGRDIFRETRVFKPTEKWNNSFPPIKATAAGFSAVRKPLLFGKFFYKVIILKSNVRVRGQMTKLRYTSFLVETILESPLFWLLICHKKRKDVSYILSFLFPKVCVIHVASLLFWEFDQIYTTLSKTMLGFS